MALVLTGLWKKEEIRAEQRNNVQVHAEPIWEGDAPVKTRDVKLVLRKYFKRKLRRIWPASTRTIAQP